MKENTSNEIINLLKDFVKALLKDSIKTVLLFTILGIVANHIIDNSFLEEGFFLKLALYIIFGTAIIRGMFLALAIIIILLQAKDETKKAYKEATDFVPADYEESLEHYKEVFDFGSPMISRYLNNPNGANVINQDVFAAGLMHLIDKGNIQIRAGLLEVVDPIVSLNCEKLLIDKIHNGRFDMGIASHFYQDLEHQIAKDAVDKLKLLEKAKPKYKGYGKLIILAIIALFVCALVVGEDSDWYGICELGAMVLAIYGIFYAMSLSRLKPTREGEKLNRKIEGLKKYFLKSYDVLQQKNDEELMTQYLFHLVAFGHNPQVVNEYMKYVDIAPEP